VLNVSRGGGKGTSRTRPSQHDPPGTISDRREERKKACITRREGPLITMAPPGEKEKERRGRRIGGGSEKRKEAVLWQKEKGNTVARYVEDARCPSGEERGRPSVGAGEKSRARREGGRGSGRGLLRRRARSFVSGGKQSEVSESFLRKGTLTQRGKPLNKPSGSGKKKDYNNAGRSEIRTCCRHGAGWKKTRDVKR